MLRNIRQPGWRGGRETRGGEQMAQHSPFPCGLDSKPVQSEGIPLGPVAWRVSTSEQTTVDKKNFFNNFSVRLRSGIWCAVCLRVNHIHWSYKFSLRCIRSYFTSAQQNKLQPNSLYLSLVGAKLVPVAFDVGKFSWFGRGLVTSGGEISTRREIWMPCWLTHHITGCTSKDLWHHIVFKIQLKTF